jgi:RNA ligase (TIGR02306 family)
MRKLASVQRVRAIEPIPGADNIELAKINGWQCVVKKGEFQVGDLGVYLEIDSVPPEHDTFRWLWQPKGYNLHSDAKPGTSILNKRLSPMTTPALALGTVRKLVEEPAPEEGDGFQRVVAVEVDVLDADGEPTVATWPAEHLAKPRPLKERIKTIRLRGCLSQGLLLPLKATLDSMFDSWAVGSEGSDPEGADLTELLGVTKYEPPAPSGMGDHAGPFPGVVPKTDEARVQSLPAVLDELRGKPFVATVKVDGTSATFLIQDETFKVCGRNFAIKDGDNLYWYVAKKHNVEAALRTAPHLAIQGEVVGPGIQKNLLGLKDKALYVFSIYDTQRARFLLDREMRGFCREHGLTAVPVAFEGDAFNETVESLLAKAEGYYEGTRNDREGIVIRPRDEELTSSVLGGRLSFKAISNRYLLKEKD